MRYRTMPKNGDQLSILGFGCMRLPATPEGAIDEGRAIAQIRSVIDAGVNYVDTAWPYHAGASEPLLGKALRDGYRDKVKLATKLPSWLINNRADMDRFLNAQLARLETDHIDYYLVHALDGPLWDAVAGYGVAGFLDAARSDGRIVNAGFSFHGLLADFKRIVDAYPWVFCQIQYNYLDTAFQAGGEGLRYAAERGLGVVIMEPLRGGLLGRPTPPPAVAALWEAAPTPRAPVEWALRFVWDHPEVTLLLSGMNEESHIAQNLAVAADALPDSLTAEEKALIDRAAATYKELMQVGCTGCGYCMPCPQGVQIPKCFDAYNGLHLSGDAEMAKFLYALSVGGALGASEPGFASKCVACGECLEKCPQHIAIPEVLTAVAAAMEDAGLEQRLATAKRMFTVRPD
ncbi:MAG: aldo/keto reductase [Solidesulfovibrio sp. DCME]|uniref:aldo/keto reductase n=1 Tax=Solidesulfovibrio sp. DCME TaxID=3447380 RepID=UPI003D0E6E6E